MNRTNLISGAAAVAVMLLALLVFSGGDSDDTGLIEAAPVEAPATEAPAAEAPSPDLDSTQEPAEPSQSEIDEPAEPSDPAPAERFSDLPSISPAELPPEAIDTLLLIAAGGPYPYRQDDETFQNREGLLPDRELGHYREYTVDTPGSDDRGARRIVSGADGELYYTDDHYDSFREIVS